MRRNIIRYILVVISFFSVLGVQAQGDIASLEAMIKNHKQVRGLLESESCSRAWRFGIP